MSRYVLMTSLLPETFFFVHQWKDMDCVGSPTAMNNKVRYRSAILMALSFFIVIKNSLGTKRTYLVELEGIEWRDYSTLLRQS
jgi:hypothetical protein